MELNTFTSMNWLTGAGIAAGFAALGAFWGQARGLMRYVTGFVLLQKTLSPDISSKVALYLRAHYTKLPSGLSKFQGVNQPLDGSAMNSTIPFDMPSVTSLWRGEFGWFLISAKGFRLHLTSVRGISNPYSLVESALQFYEALHRSDDGRSFYVVKKIGTAGEMVLSNEMKTGSLYAGDPPGAPQLTSDNEDVWSFPNLDVDKSFMYPATRYMTRTTKPDPFKGLFFDQEIHELIAKLGYWLRQRDWYANHGIPWRTGVLFHGPSGTGKSSLALAIAQKFNLPLVQFYMNTFTDKEFSREWDSLPAPCVVVLEDIDTVFHGRKPMTVHRSLSFECVLNQISGVNSLNGILLVVTTNLLEHVDPALGQLDEHGRPTRPGRIDHIVYFGEASLTQRQAIAHHIFHDWMPSEIEDLVEKGAGCTAAQFQSMCSTRATALKMELDAQNVNDGIGFNVV
jgi:ATPase family associated with various cellular activities (AAA)